MNKAIFLDRDGTVIVDKGYLSDPEGIEFIPGVLDALRAFQRAGYLLVMASNQSGIGRGFFSEEAYRQVESRLDTLLRANGIEFAGHYFCPHAPGDGCECRKPKPLMAFRAAEALDIDLTQSYMAGDKDSDIAFGANFGVKAAFRSVREAAAGIHITPRQ